MPKGYGYQTGGKHDGKGLAPYDSGSKGTVDVGANGAGMGTHRRANSKDDTPPGGYGSKGGRSSSTPSKGM